MKVRLGYVLAVVLCAAGCWPQMGGNAGNTHFNDVEDQLTADNVKLLSLVWQQERVFENFWRPVVWGDTLYTLRSTSECGPTCTEAVVEARDPASGAIRWERPLPSVRGFRGPVYLDDALWVPYVAEGAPACTGTLERLDPATGRVVSRDEVPEILSPIVGEGALVAHIGRDGCSDTRALVVRTMSDRKVVGTHVFTGATTVEQPVRALGRWFVVADGDLHAFDALGNELWKRDTEAIGRPEAVGRQVFIRTATGIQGFDAEAGALIGQTPAAATVTGFAVAYDKLYVNEGSELAVYETTGAPLWTVPLADVAGTPTVGGGVVYVAAGFGPDSAVVAVDADGCGAATCGELHRVTYFTRTPPNEYVLASGKLFGSGYGWGLFGFAP